MSVYGLQRWFLLGFLSSVVLVSSSIHAQYVELAWDQYSPSLADEWDWPASLAEPCDTTGGIWACGITGYECMTAVRYSSGGNQVWLGSIGPQPGRFVGAAGVIPLPGGGAYVAGSQDDLASKAVAVKFDAVGDTSWVAEYESPLGFTKAGAIAVDHLGSLYLASLNEDIWGEHDGDEYALVKYDSSGAELWSREYQVQGGYQAAPDLVLDSEENAIVCGREMCIKWDSLGTLQWYVPLTGGSLHGPVVDDSDNLYLVQGPTLWKFSPYGDTLLQVDLDALVPSTERLPTSSQLVLFKDTTLYYCNNAVTSKIDTLGNVIWQTSEAIGRMDVDNDGNIYVLNSVNQDLRIQKLNPESELVWTYWYDGRGHDWDRAVDIVVNDSAVVFVLGQCPIPDEWFTTDWVTLKLVQTPFICGDINGDQSGPDIADLVYLVSYMFGEGPDLPYPILGDIDGDGNQSDIADLVYLVTYMFQGGPPPSPCN